MDGFEGRRADDCKIVWRYRQGERAAENYAGEGLNAKELGCCKIISEALKAEELLSNGLVAENGSASSTCWMDAVKLLCGM